MTFECLFPYFDWSDFCFHKIECETLPSNCRIYWVRWKNETLLWENKNIILLVWIFFNNFLCSCFCLPNKLFILIFCQNTKIKQKINTLKIPFYHGQMLKNPQLNKVTLRPNIKWLTNKAFVNRPQKITPS